MIYSLRHIRNIDGNLAVSKEFLYGYGVSKNTIKMGLQDRYNSGAWQSVSQFGSVWIYYDSIPPESRAKFHLPDANTVESMMETRERRGLYYLSEHINAALTHGYHDYTDHYYAVYRNDKDSYTYARQAAVLAAAHDAYTNQRCGLPISTYTAAIAEVVPERDYTEGALYNIFSRMSKGTPVTEIITKKRAGNENAKKTDEFTKDYIRHLYLTGNLTFVMVWELYTKHSLTGGVLDQSTGEIIELQPLSLSTVKNILTAPDFVPAATLVRLGKKAFNDKYVPYIKGHRPAYALSVVGMDDEHIPLLLRIEGQNTFQRLKAIYIFDGATRAIIGLATGLQSDFNLYLQAIRSMLLGQIVPQTRGIIPAELQADRFTQKQESEYKKYFKKINFGSLPQGRYAEGDIKELENRHFRTVNGWVGMGIKTRTNHSHVNPDSPKKYYSIAETEAIVWQKASEYNAPKLKGFKLHPSLKSLQPELLALYAGIVREIKPSRGYVDFRVDGVSFSYFIPQWDEMLAKIESFVVRIAFLPDEPGTAYIFKQKAELFLGTATRTVSVQRASNEQEEADKKQIGKGHRRKAIFIAETEAKVQKIMELTAVPMEEAEAEAILLAPISITSKELRQQAEEALLSIEQEEEEYTPSKKPVNGRKTRFTKY